MYTVKQRVFLVRKYWQTGSFKACQTAFRTEFGERRAPSKFCIKKLVKKGSLLTQHAGGRKMSEGIIHDIKERLLASPSKPLRRLSQETNLPYSTCQRAAKKAKTTRLPCVMRSRTTSDGPRKTCSVLFIDQRFSYSESWNFRRHVFYRRNIVLFERIRKLSKHACMASRKPSHCA